MSAESVALDHYRQQQRLAEAAAEVAGDAWGQVDPDNITASWGRLSPEVTVAVAGAQQAVAQQADSYLDEVLDAQGLSPASAGSVNPAAFAGIASDGRGLQSLIEQPAIGSLAAIGSGHDVPRSLAMGQSALDMIVRTQVADAGRAADQVALTARPSVDGYARLLVPPSCSRCAILAGRWYRYSAGFQRHPRCDCRHIPANENVAGDLTANPRAYFDSLSAPEQDRIFTNAGAQAIRDGADMNQVVNARRGMYTAGGRRLTRTSTTRDGVVAGRQRLMPEQIYEQTRSRDEAIELLRANGYLRGASTARAPARVPAPRKSTLRGRPATQAPQASTRPASFDDRLAAAAREDAALRSAVAGLNESQIALTAGQREALQEYESSFYMAINGQLRRGELDEFVGPTVDHIDQVMAMSRLPGEVVAWRGIDNAGRLFGPRLSGDLTGMEWSERAYVSTSTSAQVARGFTYPGDDNPKVLMRLLAPEGTGSIRVSGSGIGGQSELLLERGLRMRVVRDRGIQPDGHRLLDIEVLPARRGPTNAAPKPPTLAERVKAGILDRKVLSGGQNSKTELVTLTDGGRVVHKKAKAIEGLSARHQQDAEELGALTVRAFGLRTPDVYRPSANSTYYTFMEGRAAATLPTEGATFRVAGGHYNTDEGRLIGLVDALMDNYDRNAGNWLVRDDGGISLIDHGFAFNFGGGPAQPTFSQSNEFWRYLARRSPSTGRFEWADTDLSPTDIATARRILDSLRPEFERLGRQVWWDNMVERLGHIGRHARGNRVRIAS